MDKHLSQFHFINIAPNHIKRHLKALYIDNNRENPNNYMTAYEQTFGDSGEEKPFFLTGRNLQQDQVRSGHLPQLVGENKGRQDKACLLAFKTRANGSSGLKWLRSLLIGSRKQAASKTLSKQHT